jgi:N6-adenosine-specific RNA methylase IME4
MTRDACSSLIPVKYGKATSTGLVLADGLSFNVWETIGKDLKLCEGAVLWWLGDWLNYGDRAYGEMYTQALEASDYSLSTLQNAKWVAGRVESSLRSELLPYKAHQEVASLDPSQQAEVLTIAAEKNLTVREIRRLASAIRYPAITGVIPPAGKYECIVIDPPWPMEKIEREVAPNQAGPGIPVFEYPTMQEDQLIAFGETMKAMTDDNCHLFCWTTHKHLPMALRLLEVWGFSYVCTLVWHKNGGFQPFGLPQYNCEFVLYARHGSPKFVDTKDFMCCFNAQRREHSRKPDSFYDVVKRVTGGRRIDVFSREPRDGFDQYGNEAEKFAA